MKFSHNKIICSSFTWLLQQPSITFVVCCCS